MEFDWEKLVSVILSALMAYLAVILLTRLNGLRSFSKMSSYDFAMTVAIGSVVASTIMSKPGKWVEGVIGLATIYLLQHIVGKLRIKFGWFKQLVDNTPLLLMVNGSILEENLNSSKVKREDLFAKLREANVLKLEQVQAVVLETTGDISVLHADNPDAIIDKELLTGVKNIN